MADESRSQRRRNRDILSAYYDMPESPIDPPTQHETSTVAHTQTSRDAKISLDSSGFDAKYYLNDVFANSSLQKLLDTQWKLASEIKRLDGDMQNLVYENYNKFISATDTIRQMKVNVDSMEGEMNRLNSNMESISDNSNSINHALAARRTKIEQLSGVHRLVKRLHFLFELPSRLQKCIELKAYAQAVKYHSKSLGILQKYSHIESFRNILVECESIMKGLRGVLYKRLSALDITSAEMNSTVAMLLELNEPQEDLLTHYLSCRETMMRSTLDDVILRPVSGSSDERTGLVEIMTQLQSTFIKDYLDFAESFLVTFSSEESPAGTSSDDKFFDFTDKIFGYMYSLITPKIQEFKGESIYLLSALEILLSGLRHVQEAFPASYAYDRGISLVQTAIKSAVDKSLELVNNKIMAIIKNLTSHIQDSSQQPLAQQISDTVTSITNEIKFTLAQLEPLFVSNSEIIGPHRSTLILQLFVGMQKMFLTIGEDLLECALPGGNKLKLEKDQKPPIISLVLSRICLSIYETEIQATITYLQDLLPVELQDHISDHADNLNQEALKDHMHSTAVTLLELYVDREALKLSQIIRKSIAAPNWIKYREPREVRMALDMILGEIQSANTDVVRVYKEVKRSGSVSSKVSSSSKQRYRRHGGQGDNLWKARVVCMSSSHST
eukprot:TRINITY_DN6194_c0_g2_i4.p1 TRINITY_DN6194_c0_g2~~TRINITY_DN6194_c0_g2_i4.p1  ORF type:complete len:670 (-),score=117.72 TRINITY_DN6194_c0_g2_i4:43-2052(-)